MRDLPDRRARARRRVVALVAVVVTALNVTNGFAKTSPGTTAATTAKVSVLDYAQCQNKGATPPTACKKWGNGILNTTNSAYHEDDVTPQRLLLQIPAGAPAEHSVDVRYMTFKGSANAHAYDSLATWNHTQRDASPCQGIESSCPAVTEPDTLEMPSDPNTVGGSATSGHELPPSDRLWVMYGGDLTSATVPVHSLDPVDTGTDYATVRVTFTVADTSAAHSVLLLFGGHLAPSDGPRGWGAGAGSANINGGPYHIILDKIDGDSGGGRDNQIQASAILSGSPAFTVDKTASPSTVNAGGTVTYSIVVTNTGAATGSLSFVDDFDDRLSPTTPTSKPNGGTCTLTTAAGNKTFQCTTSSIDPGKSQTFTYTATMPTTFTGTAGGTPCTAQQFLVRNTVLVDGQPADDATVCVNAPPSFTIAKTADKATANPGDTVVYTITVHNSGGSAGTLAFVDDFDDRLSPSTPVSDPAGGTCTATTSGNRTFQCTTSSIDPGQSQTFTYTATMPSTFSGTAGGSGCQSDQYPVVNTVLVGGASQDDAIVCVNASPSFTFDKQANRETASPGDAITYTIVVRNGGSAPGSVTFVDDFDDRLSPSTPSTTPSGGTCTREPSGTNRYFDCTTSAIDPGQSQTFTYTATMPSSFAGASGGSGCAAGQYPVVNDVRVGDATKDEVVVCVTAAPEFSVTKTASAARAAPGDEVTYTIVVTNDGTAAGGATFVDDFDDAIEPAAVPTGSNGGTCTRETSGTNKRFECTTSVLAPGGGSETFTYTVAMPSTFEGDPSPTGVCAGSFPVVNTVTLGIATAEATVCVTATPDVAVRKSPGTTSTVRAGDEVTYTITVSNTSGTAEARHVTIVDTLPAGTSFVSCDGCTTSSGGGSTTASWAVDGVRAGEETSRSLTLRITTTDVCQICNTASATFDGGSATSPASCVDVLPAPDPTGAVASGRAVGAEVTVGGPAALTTRLSHVETTATSAGDTPPAGDEIASASVPTVLDAHVLRTTSASDVTGTDAVQTSSAAALGVCVIVQTNGCLVTADKVRAVATARADGVTGEFSSAGSVVEGLVVSGVAVDITDPTHTTTITLGTLEFGIGSFVAVNERLGSVTTSDGFDTSDLEVAMIHVHITGLGALQPVVATDVVVARAVAHTTFARTPQCAAVPGQSVDAHAYVARLITGLTTGTVTQGYVEIPWTGGDERQSIASLAVPDGGSVLRANGAYARAAGSTSDPSTTTATAVAEVVGDETHPACVVATGDGCVIAATLLHVDTSSTATSLGRASTSTVTILGLAIGGQPLPLSGATDIPGLGFVTFGETLCPENAVDASCGGGDVTVRALHLVVDQANAFGLPVGTDLVISEAHSGAVFAP